MLKNRTSKVIFLFFFAVVSGISFFFGCTEFGEFKTSYSGPKFHKPDSKDAGYYNNRGCDYLENGQYNEAIEQFNKAISLKPNYTKAYNNRALTYTGLGQFVRVIEDYNEMIRIEPNNPQGYYLRAKTYMRMEQPNRACSDWMKACELGDCEALNSAKKNGYCQ